MKLGQFCWPWTHVTQMNPDPGPSKRIEKSQNSFKLFKQFSYRFQKSRNFIDKANINWCNIAQFEPFAQNVSQVLVPDNTWESFAWLVEQSTAPSSTILFQLSLNLDPGPSWPIPKFCMGRPNDPLTLDLVSSLTLIFHYLLPHLGFCKAYQNCWVALIKITTVVHASTMCVL